jgi:hypothetical protein
MRQVLGQFIFNIKYSDSLCIFLKDNNPDLKFAASELKKYIQLACNMEIRIVGEETGLRKGALMLNICREYEKYDEFSISVEAGNLLISGSNRKSLLFGVYKFLEQYIGFKWNNQGYEYIPSKVPGLIFVKSNNYKPDYSSRELLMKYYEYMGEGSAMQVNYPAMKAAVS